ncbi:MAG: 2-keto-4-pentenoate hydratase [Saprospiraceae bacterium]|nr:2-keto-4-pentenoate hydratase [Saprospiraceae bacterium]
MEIDLFKIAHRLRQALETAKAIDPISNEIGASNVHAAYTIQNINNQIRLSEGQVCIGHKIGLTSKSVQKQIGIDQPDYGRLYSYMQIESGGHFPSTKLIQPKVEGEVAFVLAKDIDEPIHTHQSLLENIETICASIELVDSRIENWNIKISDTIADNASAAYFTLSENKINPNEFDFKDCEMELKINEEVVSTGTGKACMDNPINAVIWLANKLIQSGDKLKKGDIVLSGALGKFVDINKGDHAQVNISGLGSASLYID